MLSILLTIGPEVDTIYLIGAVGTASDIAASVGTIFCDTFEKTYWTVFRKKLLARRSDRSFRRT